MVHGIPDLKLYTDYNHRLAMVAFRQVLVKKQTGYGTVIAWLEKETLALSRQKGKNRLDCRGLVKVVKSVKGVS